MLRYSAISVVVVAVCVFSAWAEPDLCTCKDKNEPAGNCTLKVHVCGCLRGLKLEYEGTTTETHSGKSAHAQWFASGEGAGEHSTLELFKILGPGTCNCDQRLALVGKQPSFKAWATETTTHKQAAVTMFADPEQAALAALQGLYKANPDVDKLCNGASTEGQDHSGVVHGLWA